MPVSQIHSASVQEYVLSEHDPDLAVLEQALLDALALAQAQGDLDASRSLTAALENLRARKQAGTDITQH